MVLKFQSSKHTITGKINSSDFGFWNHLPLFSSYLGLDCLAKHFTIAKLHCNCPRPPISQGI
jgi:hypothetical protein